jgi:hypothetical protein
MIWLVTTWGKNSRLVRPVDERLVPVAAGVVLHRNRARRVTFPVLHLAGRALRPEVCTAIATSQTRKKAVRVRRDLMHKLGKTLAPLKPRNEELRVSARERGRRSEGADRSAGDYGIAEMCCRIDATNYSDRELGRRLLEGFPITGEVPESVVHRPVVPTVAGEEFWKGHDAIMNLQANWAWAVDLKKDLRREGQKRIAP